MKRIIIALMIWAVVMVAFATETQITQVFEEQLLTGQDTLKSNWMRIGDYDYFAIDFDLSDSGATDHNGDAADFKIAYQLHSGNNAGDEISSDADATTAGYWEWGDSGFMDVATITAANLTANKKWRLNLNDVNYFSPSQWVQFVFYSASGNDSAYIHGMTFNRKRTGR